MADENRRGSIEITEAAPVQNLENVEQPDQNEHHNCNADFKNEPQIQCAENITNDVSQITTDPVYNEVSKVKDQGNCELLNSDEVGNQHTDTVKLLASEESETGNKLLKAREELSRAKNELAKAKDDVEKAKANLVGATDCSSVPKDMDIEIDKTCTTSTEVLIENNEIAIKNESEIPVIEEDKELCEPVLEFRTPEPLIESEEHTKEDAMFEILEEPHTDIEPVQEMSSSTEMLEQNLDKEIGDAQINEREEENIENEEEEHDDLEEEDESEDDVVVEGEREEGDGEESETAASKALDDDEDRRNPQYIPKRGGFYEHDDRTREETEEIAKEEPVVKVKTKKSLRSDAERWGHDMYIEAEQTPKSDQELVAHYGYDIRKEEGAPRARRRRRYGRGPNKYSRTWEDEEAYSKPRPRGGAARGGRGRSKVQEQVPPRSEDFPPLNTDFQERSDSKPGSVNRRETNRRDDSHGGAISFRRGGGGRTFDDRNKGKLGAKLDNAEFPGDQEEEQQDRCSPAKNSWKNHKPAVSSPPSSAGGFGMGGGSYRGGNRGRKGDNPGRITEAKMRQMDTKGEQPKTWESKVGRGRGKFSKMQEGDVDIAGGLQRIRIDDHATSRTQDANASRSKRYSSQRQRATTPPPPSSGVVMPPFVTPAVSTGYYAPYNDSPPPNFVPPASYSDGPPLLPLVGGQGGPPPFMAPPMGYPAPSAAAQYSGGFQGYPSAAAPPVGVPLSSPTQDMFAGGIMYYDTGRQAIRPQSQPVRRAKAAIPIVAPDADIESLLGSGNRHFHE